MGALGLSDLAGAGAPQGLDIVATQPVRRYRRTFRLNLPTGGRAERLLVDAAALHAVFTSRTLDVRSEVAAEPVTVRNRSDGVHLELRVARRIRRIRLSGSESSDQIRLFRIDGDDVAEDPVDSDAHGSSGASLDVVGQTFVLRRRRGGSDTSLSPSAVDVVEVEMPALVPRVAIAIVGDAEGRRDLPPHPEAADPSDFGERLKSALADQVERFQSARSEAELPSVLEVDLIFEADAPCQVTVSSFALAWRFERGALTEAGGKVVLRFPGGRAETRHLEISIPSGIELADVPFELLTPPGAERRGVLDMPAEEATPLPAGNLGLEVEPGSDVAIPIIFEQPHALTGLDVALAALEGAGRAAIRLLEDLDGQPGPNMAQESEVIVAAGPLSIHRVEFEAKVVDAGPAWVAVRAASGRVIVGLASGAGGSVMQGDGRAWRPLRAAQGQCGIVRPLVRERPQPSQGLARPSASVFLSLQGLPVSLETEAAADALAARRLRADLAPTIASLSSGLGETTLNVAVTSTLKGPHTITAPRLRYRLS